MAFDLYLAGECGGIRIVDSYLIEVSSSRLFSQFRERPAIKRYLDSGFGGKLFIDSGAYTAYTKQVSIDVDDYINYVNELDSHLTIFAQLDKIPGQHGKAKTHLDIEEAPKLSWDNYLYMREKVNSPDKLLPIFHRRESWHYLKQMLETTFNGKHIPYIGLAATTDSSIEEKTEWFMKVFSIIKNSSNPNVKTHAFGMTSLSLLESFPFTSADSTTWIMCGAFGAVMTPFGNFYVSDVGEHQPKNIKNQPIAIQNKLDTYLNEIGLSLSELSSSRALRILANAKYLIKWSDEYVYKGLKCVRNPLF